MHTGGGGGGVEFDDCDFAASIDKKAAGNIEPFPMLDNGGVCSFIDDELAQAFWLKLFLILLVL